MGCWNGTCFVTNTPIHAGEPVEVVFMRSTPHADRASTVVYSYDIWTPYALTVSGIYDDYGSAEDITGPAKDLVLKAFKDNLIEKTEGELKRDLVIREGFDYGALFSAIHEGALETPEYEYSTWQMFRNLHKKMADEGDERIEEEFPETQPTCFISKVLIHKKVYEKVVNQFTLNVYHRLNDEEHEYIDIGLADLLALYDEWRDPEYKESECHRYGSQPVMEMLNSIISLRSWHAYFPKLKDDSIDPMEHLLELRKGNLYPVAKDDYDVFENAVKFGWFCAFVNSGRKLWAPTAGSGSQDQNRDAQVLTAKMILERDEYVQRWEANDWEPVED